MTGYLGIQHLWFAAVHCNFLFPYPCKSLSSVSFVVRVFGCGLPGCYDTNKKSCFFSKIFQAVPFLGVPSCPLWFLSCSSSCSVASVSSVSSVVHLGCGSARLYYYP